MVPGGDEIPIAGSDSTVATVRDLENGTAYSFEVAANNGVGQSDFSHTSEPVIPAPLRLIETQEGTETIFPSGRTCGYDYVAQIQLLKRDQVSISVTADANVNVMLQSPGTQPSALGTGSRFHDYVIVAESDGRHIVIAAAGWALNPNKGCAFQGANATVRVEVWRHAVEATVIADDVGLSD